MVVRVFRKKSFHCMFVCIIFVVFSFIIYINTIWDIRQNPLVRTNTAKSERIGINGRDVTKLTKLTTPGPSSVFLTASTWIGRLGNQLFIYAAVLGISYNRGFTPYIKQDNHIDILKYLEINHVHNDDIENLKVFSEAGCCAYDPRVETLSAETNTSLSGYFQSWKYFAGAEDYVRANVKIRRPFLEAAKEFLQSLKTKKAIIIGVHIRRGDKTSKAEAKKGNSVAGKDYILKAMDYFRKRLENNLIAFIVVSDDQNWCRENINGTDSVHSPFDDPGVDLAILSLCDHVIITAGTFGWWGAWLSGGKVVFYNGFPRENSWLAAQMTKGDYYPLNWVGMS